MKKFTLIDKAFILKTTTLFHELELDLLLPIADKLTLVSFDSGDAIFNIGADAHRMYFIIKGNISMKDASNNTLAALGPNDFFGDESLFSEQPRAYNAICQTDVTLLALSKTNLLTIISESPAVAIGLLNAYASATPYRTIRTIKPGKI